MEEIIALQRSTLRASAAGGWVYQRSRYYAGGFGGLEVVYCGCGESDGLCGNS